MRQCHRQQRPQPQIRRPFPLELASEDVGPAIKTKEDLDQPQD